MLADLLKVLAAQCLPCLDEVMPGGDGLEGLVEVASVVYELVLWINHVVVFRLIHDLDAV